MAAKKRTPSAHERLESYRLARRCRYPFPSPSSIPEVLTRIRPLHARPGAPLLLVAATLAGVAPLAPAESGHAVPSFAVRTLDGKTFRMADQVGKPLVLDFWATWCAPCRATMPHFETIQDRYAR